MFFMARKNMNFENNSVFSVNSGKYIEGFKVKDIFHLPQVFFSRICRQLQNCILQYKSKYS